MTYFEFSQLFPDETSAINYIVKTKYANGYVCPKCGTIHKHIYHQHYDPRKLYCNNCKSEFSALVGTIFEHTHLDMRMWLYAINLCLVSRKGISALQLQLELGMGSYKSAWRMLHLIRMSMGKDDYKDIFEAIVEIDETYVGGKPRKENKHSDNDDYKRNKRGRGTSKTPVVGVIERGTGRIHAKVALPNKDGRKLSGKQLLTVLNDVCKKGTIVMTDQLSSYGILDSKTDNEYVHIKIDHNVTYSLGDGKHTNSIESCWAILKRAVYGIFHHVSVKYMQMYVDEFCFRLSNRKNDEAFIKCVRLAVKNKIVIFIKNSIMALLKEDGSLDIERINKLPYEEYMEEMGTLTEEQVNEYLFALPINESKVLIHPVVVDYTLEDELKKGAEIANDYIQNKMRELRKKL